MYYYYHYVSVWRITVQWLCHLRGLPVPVAAPSKAWFFGRLPAEFAGSNLAGGMGICVAGKCLCIVK